LTDAEQSELVRTSTNAEEFTPAARLAQVRQRSSEYEREYRLQLIHRLLMRNLPLDEIAAQLGVSVSTVLRDRSELKERLRAAAKELDIEVMIGNSKGFYEEVQAMAMRAASNNQVPMPMRLAAMRTSLAAHNDMHRFYQAAGVYDVLRFRKGAADGAQTDIQRLMALTEEMLTEAKRDNRTDPLGQFSGTDTEGMNL
jgi:Trp operon repressor